MYFVKLTIGFIIFITLAFFYSLQNGGNTHGSNSTTMMIAKGTLMHLRSSLSYRSVNFSVSGCTLSYFVTRWTTKESLFRFYHHRRRWSQPNRVHMHIALLDYYTYISWFQNATSLCVSLWQILYKNPYPSSVFACALALRVIKKIIGWHTYIYTILYIHSPIYIS